MPTLAEGNGGVVRLGQGWAQLRHLAFAFLIYR